MKELKDMPRVDTILDPYWMVINDRMMLDQEYQSYVIQAAKLKYDQQLKAGKADNMYEVTLHLLNLNTMVGDRKVFNQDMIPYHGDDKLTKFVDNFFMSESKKKDSPAKSILSFASEHLIDALGKYLDIEVKTVGGLDLIYRNKRVHMEPVVFLVLNVKSTDVYDVWMINLDIKKDIAGDVRNIGNFKAGSNKESKFAKFINEYNEKTDNIAAMRQDNTIVLSMDMASDHHTIVTAIKDIILYNKLFVGNVDMDTSILVSMKNTLMKENRFPYKLTVK